jgi:hypothetical protein
MEDGSLCIKHACLCMKDGSLCLEDGSLCMEDGSLCLKHVCLCMKHCDLPLVHKGFSLKQSGLYMKLAPRASKRGQKGVILTLLRGGLRERSQLCTYFKGVFDQEASKRVILDPLLMGHYPQIRGSKWSSATVRADNPGSEKGPGSRIRGSSEDPGPQNGPDPGPKSIGISANFGVQIWRRVLTS